MKIYFPGLGLIVCIILVYLCGLIVTTFIGKWLWNKVDSLFNSIPVVGQMYKGIKEILGYDTSTETVFKQVVLLPAYGGCGEELGLVTNSFTKDNVNKIEVFVPGSPAPTSGRLVVIDKEKVKILDTNASETFKTMISMGKTDMLKDNFIN